MDVLLIFFFEEPLIRSLSLLFYQGTLRTTTKIEEFQKMAR